MAHAEERRHATQTLLPLPARFDGRPPRVRDLRDRDRPDALRPAPTGLIVRDAGQVVLTLVVRANTSARNPPPLAGNRDHRFVETVVIGTQGHLRNVYLCFGIDLPLDIF
jgi:hypothetical protein